MKILVIYYGSFMLSDVSIFCIRILHAEKWELDNISDDYSISPVDMQLGWDDASILIHIRVTNAGD